MLPVTLDVGCNVEAVREDPLYIGLRQPRLRGNEYYALVDEFMEAAQIRFGRTLLLQFEDFGNSTAFHLLERWRDRACCFNDDMCAPAVVPAAPSCSLHPGHSRPHPPYSLTARARRRWRWRA